MSNIDGCRKTILHLLRRSDSGLTIDQLCETLQVTPMAVQRPLSLLLDQGLVTAEQIHSRGRGRPAYIYKISETADELFPKNYGRLALEILTQLREKEGDNRIRKLFEGAFKKSAEKIKQKIKGLNLRSRVKIISESLAESSYMSEYQQLSNGKFELKIFNCPISKVAKEFPYVCSCEQRSLSQLLQADVSRDRHILKGQNYCSYIIERK